MHIVIEHELDLALTEKSGPNMTRDSLDMVELLQGPFTRVMARKMEEEHKGRWLCSRRYFTILLSMC